ncbi:MAG: hypothetical protein JO027_13000 [Solirubrobacterales bacterium]|nr:hypothetical protein [Solirubrobacterales bacterium]MBV9836685.1 hypothetical protein [Solirubrobacterales bacterium]
MKRLALCALASSALCVGVTATTSVAKPVNPCQKKKEKTGCLMDNGQTWTGSGTSSGLGYDVEVVGTLFFGKANFRVGLRDFGACYSTGYGPGQLVGKKLIIGKKINVSLGSNAAYARGSVTVTAKKATLTLKTHRDAVAGHPACDTTSKTYKLKRTS